MNLATIIGFVFGIALMSWASYDAAATAGIPLMKLWSFVSLLIVVGGIYIFIRENIREKFIVTEKPLR